MVAEPEGDDGETVAAVLHGRFPQLLHYSEMEW
jgi:hypothetical protein